MIGMLKDLLLPKTIDQIFYELDNFTNYKTSIVKVFIDNFYRFSSQILEIVKSNKFEDPSALKKLFEEGCKQGYIELVDIILKKNIINPSDNNNFGLRLAYYHDRDEIIKRLLLEESVICKLSYEQINELI